MLSGLKRMNGKWCFNGSVPRLEKRVHRRLTTSAAAKPSNNAAMNETIDPPTRIQLRRVFLHAAVPMIGFGIMDQVRFVHIPVTFGRRSFG